VLTLRDKVLPSSMQAIKFSCEHILVTPLENDVHVLSIALSFTDNRWSILINEAMTTSKDGTAHTEIGQHNTISGAMEDLPEAKRTSLEKELQEGMAAARRRKLAYFQKTRTGVIKKTAPTVTTTATMASASTVTPNMTHKEIVKFMDVAVASKYGNDLSSFTRVITDDACSTLESFKTDLQNTYTGMRHRVNNRILHASHLTWLHRVTWGF
jgi:hypothetical protein